MAKFADYSTKILEDAIKEWRQTLLQSAVLTKSEQSKLRNRIRQVQEELDSRKKSTNPGIGKGFTFHGSFQSQILARRKEIEIPGSFVIKRGNRYYVLKPKRNPPSMGVRTKYKGGQKPHVRNNPRKRTLIYGELIQIWAKKTSGPFKGQRFTHKFKSKPKIYGLSNGALLIQ